MHNITKHRPNKMHINEEKEKCNTKRLIIIKCNLIFRLLCQHITLRSLELNDTCKFIRCLITE